MRWSVLGALIAACANPVTPASSPETGPRLVSLSPAITETIGALGALDTLVARSDWCNAPPAATALPPVGSSLTPNLEKIVALQPTAILLDGSAANPVDDLRAIGKVEVLPWLTADELVSSTRRLGGLTGRQAAADALADRLAAALRVPPTPGAPEVLLVLGAEPGDQELWYIKRNSLHGAALHAAGGRNAIDRDVDGAPTLSVEGLLTLNPAYVIVLLPTAPDDAARAAALASWSRMKPLRAVSEGHIGVIGGPLLLSPGPAILDTIGALRAELTRLTGAPTPQAAP